MPTKTNREDDIDALGVLIVAAYGLDRTWTEEAKCKDFAKASPVIPTPWEFSPGQKVRFTTPTGRVVQRAAEMIPFALLVCSGCQVQHDCATYAVTGRMYAGTWAMDIHDLHWLQHQDDALDIIEMARRRKVPVQRHVGKVRASRTAA